MGAIPKLVSLALDDQATQVRKKAILALSSAIRNYQPALDAVVSSVPNEMKGTIPQQAHDMEGIDRWVTGLRENLATKS